jgi:tetratricopeptide (TPR) repeat protein
MRMPEGPVSIQDVLRRRRTAGFVGRDGPLALFRENFDRPATDEGRFFVFNVHGEGGVGKSTLLEQWRLIARQRGAADARIDEHVYGVPEAMAAVADQLGTGAMKEFQARYSAFLRGREQIERDPQAPLELWSRVARTGVKVGLHASKVVPGAGPVVDLVDGELAAEAVDRVRVFLTRTLRDSRDVRLLLSPAEELSPVFVSGLATVAARVPVVLFFDTFEQTGAFLDGWLRDLLAGRYGELPLAVLLVVAGRLPLDANRWSEFLGLVEPVPLAVFTEAEARQLLAVKGVTDERTVEVILALSGGLPLLVDMLAKNRPADPSAVGDPSGTAVERFLKWEQDEARQRAALAGALPRRVDEDLLAAATDMLDASAVFGWLSRQPFVSAHAGRYQYHEVVRAPMLRWQRQRSLQRWRADHVRLAERYRRWREGLGPEADWSDTTWRDYQIEETYHRLCAGQVALAAAVQDGVSAAKVGPASARRWAEMITEAGRDLDNDQCRACGKQLLASVDEDAKDCLGFLSVLLQLGYLDAVNGARALAERARIHYFADRDEQAIQECASALERDHQCADAYVVRAEAQDYLRRRDLALADFNRAIELNPSDAKTIALRGQTYRLMKRYDEALTDLNQAIELNPTLDWAIANRGLTYRAMKRYDEALSDFSQAIELDPNDAWAITNRGQTYGETERYDEALSDYNRAIELNPSDAWAITNRGRTYGEMKRYDEALADFNRAIELNPSDAGAIANHGKTYQLMERYEEALADFNRAIELDPAFAWAIVNRSRTYGEMERYDEALSDLNRAIELDSSDAWTIANRGRMYRLMERYDEALTDLNQAIELNPTLARAIANRGLTYQEMKRYDEALADFNRAIELDASDDWAIGGRGKTYQLMDRFEEALVNFNWAIELNPGYAWAIADRGQTYRLMKRYDEALTDLNRAIELNPTLDWAIANRGLTYGEMKRYDEALTDLNRAIELDPTLAAAIGSRGRTYRAMKRYEEALDDYNRAIELDPTLAWAIAGRGETYRLMERYDEALADFNEALALDPQDAGYYGHRGLTYRDIGLTDEAEADFARARDIDATKDWTDPEQW